MGWGLAPWRGATESKASDETRAYLAHPTLGSRLLACAEAVVANAGSNATEIFGAPDDLKLRSSATLFASVSAPDSVFHRLLEKFYRGSGNGRLNCSACVIGRAGHRYLDILLIEAGQLGGNPHLFAGFADIDSRQKFFGKSPHRSEDERPKKSSNTLFIRRLQFSERSAVTTPMRQ
jgi:hypothetical protein